LDSEDQSLWKIKKWVMHVPKSSPFLQDSGGQLSQTLRAEALADSLKAQFQPADDPSELAFIEMFDEATRIRVCARK
jgi:hypothetical protein